MPENQNQSDGEVDGEGEGTLSTAALEARNTRRSLSVDINAEKIEEVNIRPDGGAILNEAFDRHYGKINALVTKLIILVSLAVIALVLWRIDDLLMLAEAVL